MNTSTTTTPTTTNPDLLHLLRTGFPVLKPQVAVDLSYELKVVIPPPTTDPFDTPAWDDLQKAIDEIRHGVQVDEKQSKKRHEREDVGRHGDHSAGESEEDEEDDGPEEGVDDESADEQEDLRMALDTQRALDGYDRIFQVGEHRVTQIRDDQLLRFDQLYPSAYKKMQDDGEKKGE